MHEQAAQLVSAADVAFAHAVSHTSLIAAIVLAAGTLGVAVLLPRQRRSIAVPASNATREPVAVG
ncbi:hypothetical protein [Nocardia sp. NPDC049526]|uniref:hypothetical protein n=1 Tax=Nocardia sp. NPDC049526 TaxID=3364316 RepID=UPI0037B23A4C